MEPAGGVRGSTGGLSEGEGRALNGNPSPSFGKKSNKKKNVKTTKQKGEKSLQESEASTGPSVGICKHR